MRIYGLIIVAICAAVSYGELDAKCAWGQSYWCSTLDAARSCGAWEHCKSTAWKNQALKQDARDSCTFCKTIIDDVKNFIESGKTKEEVTQFLDSACGIIPDKMMSDQCKHAVEFMITEVLELIESGVDSQMICSLMGVCSGLEDSVLHSPVNKPTKPDQPVSPVNEEPICGDCKKFFSDIKAMITSNKTSAEVEQLIDQNICSHLGKMQSQCKTLVHEFLPELLEFLAAYYDPNLICQSLGVCNADKMFYAPNFALFTRLRQLPPYKVPVGENSAGSCLMCKAVLTQLQTLLRDKSVQNGIKDFVKYNFCIHTGSIREMCDKTVDLYSTELFELLVNLVEPSIRCKAIGLCDSSNDGTKGPVQTMSMLPLTPAKYPSDKRSELESGPQCTICMVVIKEIVSLIGTNSTEQSIVQALEMVCHIIPEQLQRSCVDFVDTYGPTVVRLLVQELDPDLVCKALHLCDSTQMKDSAAVVPAVEALPAATILAKAVPHISAHNGEMCDVCELMVQYLEKMLQDNSTVAEIQAVLSRICYHLPAKYIDQCQNLVKQYTDLIIFYIEKLANPKQICALIGVCDKKGGAEEAPEQRQSVPVTGQNECTWGSAYWCINRDNAEKCNAVNYCKRFVWKTGEK